MENNLKLALIGGSEIRSYTLAQFLWDKINSITCIGFDFEIISIRNFNELREFYNIFLQEKNFIGFNVALPWKKELAHLTDTQYFISSESKSINTIYKKNRKTIACNTDILGIEVPLLKRTELNNKKILILGRGETGFAVGTYLSEKYHCSIYSYDIESTQYANSKTIIQTKYLDIANQEYDIIINASPVGKYHLKNSIFKYETPLSIKMLSKIIHKNTIIQEMNYFPEHTELLCFGIENELRVVSGIEMFIQQALGSLYFYFEISLSESQIKEIYQYISYICNKKVNEKYSRTSL